MAKKGKRILEMLPAPANPGYSTRLSSAEISIRNLTIGYKQSHDHKIKTMMNSLDKLSSRTNTP